jgi:hypothetical protein
MFAFKRSDDVPCERSTFRSVRGDDVRKPDQFQRLARSSTWALVLLVVQGFHAPQSAWAGCNHGITARTDPGRLPSLLGQSPADDTGPSDRHSLPSAPRPCSGAFCSGQPGTPAVPVGAFDRHFGSWAWCWGSSLLSPIPGALFSIASPPVHPLLRDSRIFHPPRLLTSA